MATLTSDWTFLGRSAVMNSQNGTLPYYLLLYAKTVADEDTGYHTVTVLGRLASTATGATFYQYNTTYSVSVAGKVAASGTNEPDSAWEYTSLFYAGSVGYQTGTDIVATNVKVDCTDGVAHDIPISFTWKMTGAAAWYTPPINTERTVSATATLAAIPRATTPTFSASPYTMGTALTINLAPANSTFKHKIRYDFGGLTGQSTGISVGAEYTSQGNTSVTFTPPTTLGEKIPNANSGSCTIHCYTYTSSGTHVGTVSNTITLNVPSYTPEVNSVTLTGNNLLSGAYVQGKSTVTVNATLKSYYGAGTKSVEVEIDSKKYTTLPCTSSALTNGSKTVKITFTDTRGKSKTYTSSAFTVSKSTVPSSKVFGSSSSR